MALLKTPDGVRLYFEHHRPAEGREPGTEERREAGPRDGTARDAAGAVGAASSRPTVIFSCAYCTTHENWRGQVEPLVAAGYPVVLWDLRAHGESEAPTAADAYSIERVVADLDAIAEATTPGRPFVAVGLSFGGLASLHYRVRHPERVAALILIASGPGFKNPEAAAAWAAQVERTASFLETRGFEAFVAGRAGSTCIGARPQLPAAQSAARAIVAQGVAGIARFGREVSGPAPPVIDELPSMDVPALVLVGEHDKAFLRAGEVMAAKLPRARHVVVPDAGHIVNIEQAERFDREVLDFLGTVEG